MTFLSAMFLFCTIASFLLKFNYPNQNRAFAVFLLCYLLIFSVTILSFLFVIIIFLSACQQYFRSALPLPFSILSLVSQVWFLLSFLFQQFFSSYFLLKKETTFYFEPTFCQHILSALFISCQLSVFSAHLSRFLSALYLFSQYLVNPWQYPIRLVSTASILAFSVPI